MLGYVFSSKASLGGGTGRRTGLKTLHRLLFSSLKTERVIAETLVWSGFQDGHVPTPYNPLQLVFGQFWKKKWQKSAKSTEPFWLTYWLAFLTTIRAL